MIALSILCQIIILVSLSSFGKAADTCFNYTVVTGLFQQDDPATNASTFDFIASNFGLIQRPYPSDSSCPHGKRATNWQRFAHYLSTLNVKADYNERYVLLFLGRHGDGYHNAAESYYGTPAWNCYWSELDGNGTVVWADAHLTETGVGQAKKVNAFWRHLIKAERIHPPETYYTSPLYRCLQTAKFTFTGLNLPPKSPFVPTIKEFLREGISAHTCDRRSNRTDIHQNFPTFQFEDGFVEEDPYWKALYSEPQPNQDARSRAALDDILSNDGSAVISITSHSGEIASLFRGEIHTTFSTWLLTV